ncbi:acyl-CoA dehydrogenase [Hahella sp. CCB-MM4]|uniref:acyl-CoA dehydrogenase n=1 Tax=Hahella sp. (strain CCB-MM4) TaxID=1926491 RepID=UPI000B9A5110|nr:acyl-CoA dehydrogenase [Hahella sp. CCB-MM4]OZG72244.1 acyl-CoA dehydrogenase [Hahella sp. CCB-MM4]
MSHPVLNRREVDFQLFEVLETQSLVKREHYSEHSEETFAATLDTAEKLSTNLFAPHNSLADKNEPVFDGVKVSMMPEVKLAFEAFAEAGFIRGRLPFEEGGMQLPETVMTAAMGYFTAANPSTAGYPFLTMAAANLIRTFANDELKARFLEPMLTGRFSGTMALTEPHAGSSLADILSTAIPKDDGTYSIKGSKLFISGGEHELTENIIHLMLARIKGAPAGVKGISLFIVPKKKVGADGSVGEANGVNLAGLIHKLGYRGTTSTALSFGGDSECVGYLVGEPHQGLKYMFQMMNEARLGVGFGATVIGYQGYQYSLQYAKERTQGRLPSNADPSKPPVSIIQHSDVKRMLLAQKAYVEGGYALCMYGASLIDDLHTLEDEAGRQKAAVLLDLLTPVIKAWPSEYCTKANDLAIQVLGGAGYTREYPVEQYWRDNRLNPIHEGTNGIQALDLLGRKIWLNNSQALLLLQKEIAADISASGERTRPMANQLEATLGVISKTFMVLADAMKSKGPDVALANASCFLNLFGHAVVAWMWLRMANTAAGKIDQAQGSDVNFYQGKLQAAQYFYRWELPLTERDARLLQNLDDTCLAMNPDWF